MVSELPFSNQDCDYKDFQLGDYVFVAKANCENPQPAVIVALLPFGFVDVQFETDGPNTEPVSTFRSTEIMH
jgi:hypothetical protein